MVKMKRSVKQKVVAATAVAVLIAGGSIAAVSATGQSNSRRHAGARHGAHRGRGRGRDVTAAAAYLGIPAAQLTKDLSSHETLAQVAGETPGKSVGGLSEALVAAHKARLASAAAELPQHVAIEINRAGGPGGPRAGRSGKRAGARAPARLDRLFATPAAPGTVAAAYLGIAPLQLRAQLQSGKTLARVAETTPDRSTAGLVAALVTAKRTKLQAAAAGAGKPAQAREAKRVSRLDKRVGTFVQHQFAGAGSA